MENYMKIYDFKKGKERIKEILDNDLKVIQQNKVPSDTDFTFSNGYYSWVTGIFVDIRNSSKLFADEDKEKVAKIIRCFSSEVIEILRNDDNLREIGIRGDCVYAIYTTPLKDNIYDLVVKTAYINSYMHMLNKLLLEHALPEIHVGIGMSTSKELVVKAGRKDTGINNKVWIGEAVTKASNFSSIGNKNGFDPIVFSSCSYDNFIDKLVTENINNDPNPKSWFKAYTDKDNGKYYTASIVASYFEEWILNGMQE